MKASNHLSALVISLLALTGCTDKQADSTTKGAPLITLAPHDAPGAAAAGLGLDAAVTGVDQLGFDLLRKVQGDATTGNKVLSPYSAYSALSMLAAGAEGSTLEEMNTVLGMTGASHEDLGGVNKALLQQLKSTATDYSLGIANSTWVQEDFDINSAFRDSVQSNFDATVRNVDFSGPDAVNDINQWVTNSTNGRIPKLFDQLDAETRLVVANTVYFKGKWRFPFSVAITAPDTFTKADNSTVEVPFMLESTTQRHIKTAKYEAILKEYSKDPANEGSTAMILIKPAGKLQTLVDSLSTDVWTELMGNLTATEPSYGNLKMPKLKMSYQADNLKESLAALGMSSAFQGNADFSGISDSEGLTVSSFVQKTFLSVDEKGTEAAAATGGGASASSIPPPPAYDMVLDRPYIFAIVHLKTNTILFLGTIEQPAN